MTDAGKPPAKLVRDPGSRAMLQSRIATASRLRGQTVMRIQRTVAQVVLAQLLPAGAVKGGAGMKMRLGQAFARDSADLDTAIRSDFETFTAELSAALQAGWGSFTGTVTEVAPPTPVGVPQAYVMRPYAVKLAYRTKSFATVILEIGYDELDLLAGQAQPHLAPDIIQLFLDLGLPQPAPVALLPVALQIAQKLHACSTPGSDRAHDLVDLQLLAPDSDPAEVAAVARRLFGFRRAQSFPPHIVGGDGWDTIYREAAEGLGVAADVISALEWARGYVVQLADVDVQVGSVSNPGE